MPKTNMCKPSKLVQIEQELREACGGARYITAAQICRLYGIKYHPNVEKMMEGFTAIVMPSGRRKWKLEDVAKMEYQRTVVS